MTVEQSPFRDQDWHLLSPSATPNTSSFKDASLFQTPKAAASPSHFSDAFHTPQGNRAEAFAGTPLFTFESPTLSRNERLFAQKHSGPGRLPVHGHLAAQSTNTTVPPLKPAHRLSPPANRTSTPAALRNAPQRPSTTSKVPHFTSNMDPSQIQTPPPTREANSRQKHVQSQPRYRTITPATSRHRPSTAIAQDQNTFTQTPIQFPSLQISPDAMSFGHFGPMSAPTYPQQRLFWDQTPSLNMGANMNLPTDDPFGPTSNRNSGQFGWQAENSAATQMAADLSQHHMLDPINHDMLFNMPTSEAETSGHNIPFQQNAYAATSGVDPSMLYSFSGSFDMSGLSNENSTLQASLPDEASTTRQPYEQQTREMQREREQRELARQRRQQQQQLSKQQHSRTNTASTTSSTGSFGQSSRPPLQRSQTENNMRRDKHSSIHARTSFSSSSQAEHVPRRSSPIKRLSSQSQLTAIPETIKARPRTKLVIDENGYARTETHSTGGEDQRSSGDYRTQYPGLYDEDDSSGPEDGPTLSRNNSFAFPNARPSSKHARDSLGKSGGSAKKVRPTSFINLQKAFEKPTSSSTEDLSSSLRRYSMSSFNDSLSLGDITSSPTGSQGDAQNALKAVREGRIKTQQRTAQSSLKAHNQRWSQAAMDSSMSAYADPFTSSPTSRNSSNNNMEFATPRTNRSSTSGDTLVRCVCDNPNDEDGFMILCDSCNNWMHGHCVGILPQAIPSVYLCITCTGATPALRGRRIREPNRAPPNPYNSTSPLNHKSTFRRP